MCLRGAQPSAEIVRVECTKCWRECDLSGVRATLCGDRACRAREMQVRVRFVRCARNPHAEIVRDLSHARATLGDRAGRLREMQARVRFVRCACNPLQRSCGSSARNAGESAIYPIRAQPSAETVRVECAKSRREGNLSHARAYLGSWKMRTGDLVVQL